MTNTKSDIAKLIDAYGKAVHDASCASVNLTLASSNDRYETLVAAEDDARTELERAYFATSGNHPVGVSVTDEVIEFAANFESVFDGRGELKSLSRVDRERYLVRAREMFAALGHTVEKSQ